MSRDDIEDDSPPEEDAFYEADYDEDTIDYELDADDLLEEEESYPSNSSSHWETIDRDEAPLPSLDPEFELDAEGEFKAAPAAGIDPPWANEGVGAEADAQQYSEPWPFGLIAAAILALVLLTAGGYGVVQQRAAMAEEIRQLQADLATTASKQDMADNRQSQRAVDARNDDLQFQISALQRENKALQEEVAGLETRLASSQPVVAPTATVTAVKEVEAKPAVVKPNPATSKPTTTPNTKSSTEPKPAVASNNRPWFVNFGSYSKEATAKQWAAKLKVDEGELIVIPGQKGSNRFYRVRVVDLPNKAIAEKIADQLEKTYKLPNLWVGQQ